MQEVHIFWVASLMVINGLHMKMMKEESMKT